jgi:hypothetical protein
MLQEYPTIMYSLRPRNSARGVSPVLHEILPRIDAATSERQITAEFKGVAAYFKQDPDDIAMFWLDGNPYDPSSENHMALLRWVFATVDLNHSYSVHFLDRITSPRILTSLGVQRVKTDEKTHYRMLPGESTR